ncbi:MAG: hypothetical protein ACREF5_02910 [Candidatus Saccharimonadales bacterium]
MSSGIDIDIAKRRANFFSLQFIENYSAKNSGGSRDQARNAQGLMVASRLLKKLVDEVHPENSVTLVVGYQSIQSVSQRHINNDYVLMPGKTLKPGSPLVLDFATAPNVAKDGRWPTGEYDIYFGNYEAVYVAASAIAKTLFESGSLEIRPSEPERSKSHLP